MKLNPDCIRDILFTVESQTGFMKPTSALEIIEVLKYDKDEVLYHINQCELYGFFTNVRHYINGDEDDTLIMDLTPKAHEFIQNIRSDNVWNKTKKVAGTVGSFSIGVLGQIASDVLTKLIKQALNLP